MTPLTITPDIDKAPWLDCLATSKENGMGTLLRVARIPKGMDSGKSAVAVMIELPDGRRFIAQTSMALFLGAACALKAVEEEMSGSNSRN